MKKISIIAAAIAALSLFASCNKEQVIPTTKVTVDFKIDDLDPSTKALKQNWEDGDKINIWFNGVSSPNYCYWKQAPHLVLTRTAGAWVSSEVDEALLSASGTFNAVYESSNSLFDSAINNERAYFLDGTSFKFTGFSSNTRTIKAPLAVVKNDASYTYDSGTKKISGTISNWYFASQLQIVISGLTYAADRYALTFGSNVTYYSCLFWDGSDICASSIASCRGIYDDIMNEWTDAVSNSDGIAFYFRNVDSANAKDYTLYLVDKIDKKVYSFTKNAAIAATIANTDHCKGIKIAFSDLTNVTSSHPID